MQPSAPRDPDLVALAAQNARVHSLALAIARDAHLADDLAQDAWVALLRHRPEDSSSLSGWLAKTMRNLLRHGARDEANRKDRELAAAELREDSGSDLALERLELHQAILQAVHELKEPYRTTVLLRWFEDLEPSEIARRTGVPVRTVHTRTTRALAMLRKKLGPRWGSSGPLAAFVAWLGGMQAPAWKGTLAMQTKTKVALAAALFGSAAVVVPVVMFWSSPEVRGDGGPSDQIVAANLPEQQRDDAEATVPGSRQPVVSTDESKLAQTDPSNKATDTQPPSPSTGVRATTMLEVSAGSFLSAAPDFASFEDAVATLADAALVEEGSVQRSVEDGSINGRLAVPGSELVGSFKIMGDRYSINLEPSPGVPLPAPFGFRHIRLSFLEEQGRANKIRNAVQYHPNPNKYPIDAIAPGAEVYVGWSFEVGSKGTVAKPMSMKQTPDGTGWIIGHSQVLPSIEGQWGSTSAYDVWLQKLSGFKN